MEPLTVLILLGVAAIPGSDIAGDVGQFGGGLLGALIIASFVGWAFVQLVRIAVKPLEKRIERVERRQVDIGKHVGVDYTDEPEPSQSRGFLSFWRR